MKYIIKDRYEDEIQKVESRLLDIHGVENVAIRAAEEEEGYIEVFTSDPVTITNYKHITTIERATKEE